MVQIQRQIVVSAREFCSKLSGLGLVVYKMVQIDSDCVHAYCTRFGAWSLEYNGHELVARIDQDCGLRRQESKKLDEYCKGKICFASSAKADILTRFINWYRDGPTADMLYFQDVDSLVKFVRFVRELPRHCR